jgi:mannosyltransferase OCH1-like enzyme
MPSKKANFLVNRYFKNRTKRVHRKKISFTTPLNPVIPLHIYQTWHDKKNIPLPVQKSIDKIKEQNPEFEHHLCDTK